MYMEIKFFDWTVIEDKHIQQQEEKILVVEHDYSNHGGIPFN